MARLVPRRSAISEIRDLLEQQHPFAHCDGCLALRLGVSLAEGRAVTLSLATEPGFSRQRGECFSCRRIVELTAMRPRQS